MGSRATILAVEPATETPDAHQQAGRGGILLDFAAQVVDVRVHNPFRKMDTLSPDPFDQLVERTA